MSDEYIKKLSQIKSDIGLVQDSIFFELHTLNERNEKLQSKIDELVKALETIEKCVVETGLYTVPTHEAEIAHEALEKYRGKLK